MVLSENAFYFQLPDKHFPTSALPLPPHKKQCLWNPGAFLLLVLHQQKLPVL